MRGVINVVAVQSRTLAVNVVSRSFTGKSRCSNRFASLINSSCRVLAQSCAFPFVFNSNSYTACTTDNDTQLWCSPTAAYNGQRLYCTATGTHSNNRSGTEKREKDSLMIFLSNSSFCTSSILCFELIDQSRRLLTNSSIQCSAILIHRMHGGNRDRNFASSRSLGNIDHNQWNRIQHDTLREHYSHWRILPMSDSKCNSHTTHLSSRIELFALSTHCAERARESSSSRLSQHGWSTSIPIPSTNH